jgi:hypothetical protein
MNEYDLDSVINDLDFEKNSLKTCKNGLLLTNYEIEVLDKYKIDFNKTSSLKEILYLIDEVLDEDNSLTDLENISLSISERDYYMNTKK